MKKILTAVLLCAAAICSANDDFELDFTATNFILHHPEDWNLVSSTSNFNFLVNQSAVGNTAQVVRVFSMVEFKNPNGFKYDIIDEPVHRIYTFGIIECHNGIMNLLSSWYVDKHNHIVYTEINQPDTYLVELKTKNTSRHDLFLLVCSNN